MGNRRSTMKRKAEYHETEGHINMKKLPVDVVRDDDIIYLNVGGETMACSRSTLCLVEDSFLASMFSGRWEHRQKMDRDGNIFLNFNPDYFKLILNFLRSKEISIPEYPPPVPIPAKEDHPHFCNLVNYLGLREVFKPIQDNYDIFFCPDASNISASEDFRIVKFGYENENSPDGPTQMCVEGHNSYFYGRTQSRWKLEVTSWSMPDSVFIGVVEEDDNLIDKKRYIWQDKGASGWMGEFVFQNGKSKPNERVVCVGVIHILTLDLDAMTLTLANGRGMADMKLQSVKDPKDESHGWSFCVGFLDHIQSEVRLVY